MSNLIPTYKFALREDLKEEKQFLPTKAEPKATGWDVRAAMPDRQSLILKPFQHAKIPLGFRGFCPDGWWYELKPRSSTFGKKFLHALYGTIDETYEGELVFACQYIPTFDMQELVYENEFEFRDKVSLIISNSLADLVINFGDAIGQIIPIERQEMRVLEISNQEYNSDCEQRDAERRTGGFGSTG